MAEERTIDTWLDRLTTRLPQVVILVLAITLIKAVSMVLNLQADKVSDLTRERDFWKDAYFKSKNIGK